MNSEMAYGFVFDAKIKINVEGEYTFIWETSVSYFFPCNMLL